MDKVKSPISKFILWYLKILAKLQLKKINPVIIGVGGASGKTSLSGLIALILRSRFKVLSNEGKNSETGIPMSILGIKTGNYSVLDWLRIILLSPYKLLTNWKKYDFFVAEMGVDSPYEPKNMSYLLKIIKPKIGVLTDIFHEHSVYFDELVDDIDSKKRQDKILDLTAKEELLLLNRLSKSDIAILNIDNPQIDAEKDKIKAQKIEVSSKKSSVNFCIQEIKVSLNSFIVKFEANNKRYSLRIDQPLPLHYAKTLVLAIATASQSEISIDHSIKQIEKNFMLPSGRFSIFNGLKETVIIDSSYNNGINPMIDSLKLVDLITQKRRKVGILGDLRELGTISEYAHQKIAEEVTKTLDFVVLIGPMMQEYAAPILEKKDISFKTFATFSEAKYFILTNIKPKDIILVKGSQNTLFLERVVEMLLKNPKDKSLLCRRGKFWDKQRRMSS